MGKNWQNFIFAVVALMIVSTLLSGFEGTSNRSSVHSEHTSQQILNLMDQKLNGMDIQSTRAHIYARDHQTGFRSYDELMKHLERWTMTDEQLKWSQEFEGTTEKWTGTFTDQTTSYTEKTSIHILPMASNNDHYEVYTIFEASFLPISNWDAALQSFNTNEKLNSFDAADVFLRIEGTVSEHDALNIQQLGEKLIHAFSAEVVEEVQEESFVSLSAYTPHWKNRLITNGQEMNIQIAIRDQAYTEGLGEKTTFTIGTPLITTEY